jgi:hypothetical protein
MGRQEDPEIKREPRDYISRSYRGVCISGNSRFGYAWGGERGQEEQWWSEKPISVQGRSG